MALAFFNSFTKDITIAMYSYYEVKEVAYGKWERLVKPNHFGKVDAPLKPY